MTFFKRLALREGEQPNLREDVLRKKIFRMMKNFFDEKLDRLTHNKKRTRVREAKLPFLIHVD